MFPTINTMQGPWGLPETLTVLATFAAADSLDSFRQPQTDKTMECVIKWFDALAEKNQTQLPRQGPMANLLAALCKTAAAALALVVQAMTADDAAAVNRPLAMFLWQTTRWIDCCPEQQLQLLRTRICCEVARAGVLTALPQACEAAAAALQQQASSQHLLETSTLLVKCWHDTVLRWPQEGWCTSSAQLAGTIAPAANLAYSILQQHSSASVEEKQQAALAGRMLGLEIANTLAHNSILLINLERPQDASSSSGAADGSSVSSNRAREILLVQSEPVLKLLLLLLACTVQHQHRLQGGLSVVEAVAADGGEGKLAVPDFHSALMAAVGVAPPCEVDLQGFDDPEDVAAGGTRFAYIRTLQLSVAAIVSCRALAAQAQMADAVHAAGMAVVDAAIAEQPEIAALLPPGAAAAAVAALVAYVVSAKSSDAREMADRETQLLGASEGLLRLLKPEVCHTLVDEMVAKSTRADECLMGCVTPELLQQLLLVLLEVPLLQPELLLATLSRMQVLLALAEKQFGGKALYLCAALVAPALHKLGPLVMHVQLAAAEAAERQRAWHSVAGLLTMMLEPGPTKQAFVAAVQQQPQTCRKVLEATFRQLDTIRQDPGRRTAVHFMLRNICRSNAWLLKLLVAADNTAGAAAAAAAAAAGASASAVSSSAGGSQLVSGTSAAAAAADGHSLLVSMVKLLQMARAMHLPVTYQAVELSLQVAGISSAAAAAAALQPGQRKFAGSAAAAWLWLCGKTLLQLADVLQQDEGEVLEDDASGQGLLQLSISITPRAVFEGCAAAVHGVEGLMDSQFGAASGAAPAAVAAAARTELLDTLAAAAAECSMMLEAAGAAATRSTACSEEASSSSSSSSVAVHLPLVSRLELRRVSCKLAVAQQLRAFAAAVCGLSPNVQCCNNPDCVNSSGLSEADLVGGKSCRCGGCKVARYCCKECQVQHWKAHKWTCKQLQAAVG